MKFYDDIRGYLNTTITRDAVRADFRVLDYVTTPGSPISMEASVALQNGVLGLVVN